MNKLNAHLVSFHMRKYILNENFFENIDSEEKAYFLGFLFADGYINENLYLIDLTLHKQDAEILNKLISCLYINERPLKLIRDNYLRLIINSKKMVNDLKSHGCHQKKTFNLKFPILSENMVKHFIRGYFDGDGCVTIDKGKTLNVSIVGTIDFLIVVKRHFINNCYLNDTVFDNRHPNRNNNIRALRYGGNIIINRIYHYLYDDSVIYLNRKKNKFLDILKDKPYFCDAKTIRILKKHVIEYNGKTLNQVQLSEILSKEINLKATTIRRMLQRGYSISKIKNNKKAIKYVIE